MMQVLRQLPRKMRIIAAVSSAAITASCTTPWIAAFTKMDWSNNGVITSSGGSVSATIAGPLKDECSLSTSGGSVRVKVASGTQFKLDAATSSGGVELAGLRFEGESKRGKSVGNVNGGGPLLKLRSSGGSISVRAE